MTPNFLYQRRYWNNGWAKALRGHWYCGAIIDRTLHSEIHGVVTQVFVPNGSICKRVYEELCRMERAGLLFKEDPPWIRLETLAVLLEEEDCDITATILRWQKSKITKFYKGSV